MAFTRLYVSRELFSLDPGYVHGLAGDCEIVVLDSDGAARMYILRVLPPMED